MIPSPCNGICTLDHNDVCQGCGRNVNEISSWRDMNDKEKIEVLKRIQNDFSNTISS